MGWGPRRERGGKGGMRNSGPGSQVIRGPLLLSLVVRTGWGFEARAGVAVLAR
jgi:hypothetical protein